MRTAALVLSLLCSSGCEPAEPEPFCGGFEEPVFYEMILSKLSPNLDEFVPVQGELCFDEPECGCVMTNEVGLLRLDAPAQTEILGEIHAPGYVSTVLVHRSTDEGRTASVKVLDRSTLTILGGTVSERIERTRGHLIARIGAAEGADVTGTVFTVTNLDTGETATPIYSTGGIPDRDATATDETGVVYALNLAPGRYELSSPALATCAIYDAGWPRLDAEGIVRALELVIRTDRLTLIDTQRCFGPG